MIARRRSVLALGAVVLGSSRAPFAQSPPKIWRIGWLSVAAPPTASNPSPTLEAFLLGMRELGYQEGRNLLIEWRFAEGRNERLPGFAAELTKLKVDLIVATSGVSIRAAQQATSTIPIVFPNTGDPVGSGFVASLARPGGNITGLSLITPELSAKYLEILKAVIPKLTRVAVLGNPDSPVHAATVKEVRSTAQKLGLEIVLVEARNPEEIERGFAAMARERVWAVNIPIASLEYRQRQQIADLSLKYRLPSITGHREYAEAGGLIAYGQDVSQYFRRAAIYVDKILKGANPADLPVEQPMLFDMVINAKTARTLGLTIPNSILVQATMVIN